MKAKKSFTTRHNCRQCHVDRAWHTGYAQRLEIAGRELAGVAVEYIQCDTCGFVDPWKIVAEIDVSPDPDGGQFDSIRVPLQHEGWVYGDTSSIESFLNPPDDTGDGE